MIVKHYECSVYQANLMREKKNKISFFFLEKSPTYSSKLNLMNVDKTRLYSTKIVLYSPIKRVFLCLLKINLFILL